MMKAKKPRHWAFATLRQLGVLAAVVAAVFFLNTQVLQVVYVPTGSMEPTLPSRSFAAGFRHPKDLKRYDIITFWQGDAVLVKRVIGLPGETIEVRDGHVYADGKRLRGFLQGTHGDGRRHLGGPGGQLFCLGGQPEPLHGQPQVWGGPTG